MEKSAPTRQQLLILKARHETVRKGLGLLKSKREALMKEFFGVVEESVRMRERLTELVCTGQRRVVMSEALYGTEALNSFAHASKREVSLEMKVRNVWGVSVPEIAPVRLVRSLDARELSPVGERALVLQAARDFENAADMLVNIASKEIKLSRLGEVIRADTRKVNAITEALLPEMKKRIKIIERTLEEREREEVFRLKRYKGKR
ncbi:MAG: V-type ATP synthase subunit D [Deltaproteobacteria bacterium]|nr:V-type ATP synthase subunit D [Deltaproteobacteria bacterium]